MADILIRDLSEDIVGRLGRRAASKGHSLEVELREIVIAAAPSAASLNPAERLAIIDHFLSLSKHRSGHVSTGFIRKDRER